MTLIFTGPSYEVEVQVPEGSAPGGLTLRLRYRGEVEVTSYQGGVTLRAGEDAGLLPEPVAEGARCQACGEARLDALLLDDESDLVECTTCGSRYLVPAPVWG
jgi:DNA-directed RNA polymerase subunit RPC12/RpoP